MPARIFISWSGNRSKALAGAIADWLPQVLHSARPWMSDRDLRPGERWSAVIGDQLASCNTGLVCVTPENLTSGWLHFECGALSKLVGESHVFPILLGMEKEDVAGPLAQFQASSLTPVDFLKVISHLNSLAGEELRIDTRIVERSFRRYWPDLVRSINAVSRLPLSSASMQHVVQALRSRGFGVPVEGRVACFSEGFESHALYESLLSNAERRLYVFGRKNRKLFDREHQDFLKSLPGRLARGFDFRCLFLDPGAPDHTIFDAHSSDSFRDELTRSLDEARKATSAIGVDLGSFARQYRIHRHTVLMVIDDAVAFTPLQVDREGRAMKLTKTGFELVGSDLPIGARLVEYFLQTWDAASPLGSQHSQESKSS